MTRLNGHIHRLSMRFKSSSNMFFMLLRHRRELLTPVGIDTLPTEDGVYI